MVMYIISAGFVLYVSSYLYFFCKQTQIFVKPSSKLKKFLSRHVPVLDDPYRPLYWCPEGRIQTIVRNFIPCPSSIQYEREVVPSPDGGQVYVDWYNNHESEKFPDETTRPTVFILPGLTSTSKSNYVVSMVDVLAQQGYRVMVIVNRGLDGMPILTPKAYCATHTLDMGEVIDLFKKRYPHAPLVVVGVSLGSLMVGRYLASTGKNSQLVAAVLHSCPFSPPHCTESLERWENKLLFNAHLTRSLKGLYGNAHHQFRHIVDHEEVLQSKTIRDYDASFTAKVFGYKSVEEYYWDAVLNEEKLNAIKIPTLCVGSDDDPFSPYDALPKKEIKETDNVALVVTRGGGHVSHMEGMNPCARTYFEKIMEQFIVGIFEHTEC